MFKTPALHLVDRNLFVFAVIFLLHAPVALKLGPIQGWDSGVFSRAADELISTDFDLLGFVASPRVQGIARYFYLGFIIVVALCKVIAGPDWPMLLITLNALSEAAVGTMAVRLTAWVTGDRFAAWGVLGILVLGLELVYWVRNAISDLTFMALTFGLFVLIAYALLEGRSRLWWGVIAILPVVTFYRPTGFLLIPVALMGYLLWFRRRSIRPTKGRVPLRYKFVMGMLVVGIAATLATAFLVRQPSRWPFQPFSRAIRSQAQGFAKGEVIAARAETQRPPPHSAFDYVGIIAARLVRFFQFAFREYSLRHQLANAAFFVPMYAFGLWGVVSLILQLREAPVRPHEDVAFLAMFIILEFAFFHALTHVDSDIRYRLPVIPHLTLLAGIGMSRLRAGKPV